MSRNGKVVSLGQLSLNDTAVAHLSSGAAGPVVKSEDGEDDADDVVADGPEEDEGEISGTVAAVDVAAGTLTITPTGGGTNVVLTGTAATEIEGNGENATLADVAVGMPVKAEFDATALVAAEVKAGSEHEDSQDGGGGGGGGDQEANADLSRVDPRARAPRHRRD